MLTEVRSAKQMEELILSVGLLPFFKNSIPGYSLEEAVAPEFCFVDGVEGPWEWKGPVAQRKRCAYGKLFRNRAGFASLEWYAALANYRRQGMGFDERYEAGLSPHGDARLLALVRDNGSLNTKAMKWMGGYGKDGRKGFDSAVTRLQMQTYLLAEDFEYAIDRHGAPYGWGLTRYSTPERWLGAAFRLPDEPPQASFERLIAHLVKRLKTDCPDATEKALVRMMKG